MRQRVVCGGVGSYVAHHRGIFAMRPAARGRGIVSEKPGKVIIGVLVVLVVVRVDGFGRGEKGFRDSSSLSE